MSAALVLVARPYLLLITNWYAPASAAVMLLSIRLAVAEPETFAPSPSRMPFLSQYMSSGAAPIAAALKSAVPAAIADWFTGWLVISGAALVGTRLKFAPQ